MSCVDDYFWWRADALCAQTGGDLFFLRDGEPGKDAKRLCGMCPVRDICLAESLLMEEENGIWGGFGREARRVMANQITPTTSALAVARAAIQREADDRTSSSSRPSGRRAGDRLHGCGQGRTGERPGLASLSPRAAR